MMSKNNTTASKQYWPCFCVKTDCTAVIRWFYDAAALKAALPYCKCVIASIHPFVFNGKCVLNERVYDPEASGRMLIGDPQNLSSSSARFCGSDGICSVSDAFVQKLQSVQSDKHFTILGVLLDAESATGFSLEPFCERVMRLSQMQLEDAGNEIISSFFG